MGSRQYRDSRGSTGTTNPVRPRKKGDAIAPTRLRKKKTFSQEWVHLYGNTEKLACWCLLEETITLGTYKCFFFLFFFFTLGTTSLSVRERKNNGGRQWHRMRSSFMPRRCSPLSSECYQSRKQWEDREGCCKKDRAYFIRHCKCTRVQP